MIITILTMFPEMLASLENSPIVKHAENNHTLQLEIADIRNYADGSFRHLDDSPYGGGAGMIMKAEPVLKALAEVRKEDSYVILPIPSGKPYTQAKAHEYVRQNHLILIASHYEGIDARIYKHCDELVSLGDYILSSGEYACMNIADSVIRLSDGVIRKESTEEESFENGLLEYPQYTKPYDFNGDTVPDVLLSGNHEKIRRWKLKQSLKWTSEYREDLLKRHQMNEEEKEILKEIQEKRDLNK